MTTTTATRRTAPTTPTPQNQGALDAYVRRGKAYDTIAEWFRYAGTLGAADVQLPNIPDWVWSDVDILAAAHDQSNQNKAEVARTRQALNDIQQIINLLNHALPKLGRYWDQQILQQLFIRGADLGAAGPFHTQHAALENLFGGNHEIGALISAIMSEDGAEIARLIGRRKGSDYHPGKLHSEADGIRKALDSLKSALAFLDENVRGFELGEGFAVATSTQRDVVAHYTSNKFIEGLASSPSSELPEGEVAGPPEFISSAGIAQKLADLQAWVDGISDDSKRVRMRELLNKVPGLVAMINRALGMADPVQRQMYVMKFLSGGGPVDFKGDNAGTNAANIGRLIAAIESGDMAVLESFADSSQSELEEIVDDFMTQEGEFLQTRDIKVDEGAAAKAEFENNTQRMAREGETDEEREARRQELARHQALWTDEGNGR